MSSERALNKTAQQAPESADGNRKRLHLYTKALFAEDYETAAHLDLAGFAPEDLQKAREDVFAEKVQNLQFKGDMIGAIETLQKNLAISDETAAREVRRFCVARLKAPVVARHERGGKTDFNKTEWYVWHSEFVREKLPQKFGITFSDTEVRQFGEEGFIELADEDNFDILRSEKLKSVLEIFGLDDGIVHSPRMKAMIVRRMAEELSVADRSSFFEKWDGKNARLERNKGKKGFINEGYCMLDKILSHKGAAYFPLEEFRVPEFRKKIDDWFPRAVAEMPTEEIKPEDYQYLEQIFRFAPLLEASADVLSAPEAHAALSRYLERYFDGSSESPVHRLNIALGELENAGFSKEELVESAQKAYLGCLASENFNKIYDLQERFSFTEAFLNSPEVIGAETQTLEALLLKDRFYDLKRYTATVSLPAQILRSEKITSLKQRLILDLLDGKHGVNDVQMAVERLDFGNCPDFFESEELQNRLVVFLQGRIQPLVETIFEIGEKRRSYDLFSFEIENGFLKPSYSSNRDTETPALFSAARIAEVLRSPELVQELFYGELYEVFRKEEDKEKQLDHLRVLDRYMESLHKFFGVDPSVETEIAFEGLMQNVGECFWESNNEIFILSAENIKKYQKKFHLTDEQTRQIARKAFDFFAKHGDAPMPPYNNWNLNNSEHYADAVYDAFHLTPEEAREGAQALYTAFRNNGRNQSALEVKKKYHLEGTDAPKLERQSQEEWEKKLLGVLRNKELYRFATIVNEREMRREFIERVDVRKAAETLLGGLLSDSDRTDDARMLIAKFFPDMTGEGVLALNPVVAKELGVLKKKFPALARRFLASADAAISIFKPLHRGDLVGVLKRHPDLEQAVSGNEQYGLKLLFKFDSFDKLSRGNIQALYRFREEVLTDRPDIEVDAPEFRVAMQEKLTTYRNNGAILRAMEKAGVNTEAWLSYEEEQPFGLGQEAAISFSEMIIIPIKRIEVSLERYKEIVRSALLEYKNELTAARVPVKNVEEITAKLNKFIADRKEAEEAGDAKLVAAIGIGIGNLEKQIADMKTVSVMDKIVRGMASFDAAKNSIFKTHGEMARLEAERGQDSGSTAAEKKKSVAVYKTKIEKAKQKLKEQMAGLEKQVEDFQKKLSPLLAAVLSADRAGALVQEIREQVAEHMDHYQSDRSTLANIFSENKEKMLGKPMHIGIWQRNPDQDLYLGNYTDCCIRIDSDHMGSESTIADYMTDCGIQIVAVYDEIKNIPVAAAWCWIGTDNDDNVAFVVDNIEANTGYSAPYQDQFQELLKQFIERFAAKVGAPHVVQGQSNNDLVIAGMDFAYYKIGGYNRASGYYLEAEGSEARGGGADDEWFEEGYDGGNEQNG